MKKIVLLTLAVAFGLLGLSTEKVQAAFVNTNLALVQFQITAVTPATNGAIVITNSAGVVTTTYKVVTNKLNSQSILNMLAVEFGTAFPTGAQLAYAVTGSKTGFQVVDQNGNFILDVSSNPSDSSYVFCISNNVVGGLPAPLAFTQKNVSYPTGLTSSTLNVTLIDPDNGIFYSDSHGNSFHFSGVRKVTYNRVIASGHIEYKTISFSLSGTGSGTYFNPKNGLYQTGAFTQAMWVAVGKNIRQ